MSVEFDADAEMFRDTRGPIAPGKSDAQLAEERLRRIEGKIESLIDWIDTLAGRVRALEERSADDGK